MAKVKTTLAAAGPKGTFVYFLLKPDGTVLTSYNAGASTLNELLAAGWTALREVPLAGGGVLITLKR
jgi:hypothetical protein